MRRLIAWITLTIWFISPMSAFAQQWLSDRESSEGDGIKIGEKLLFHPGAMVEGGYDTNPVRSADPEGAGRLRVSSYADLTTRGKNRGSDSSSGHDPSPPPKLRFRLGLAGYYDFYFSDVQSIDDLDELGLDGHLKLVVFPEGKFSFLLGAQYLRVPEPYRSVQDHYARNNIRPELGFRIRPGGGTLTVSLTGKADIVIFDEDVIGHRNNRAIYDLQLETAWRFVPKTALVSRIRFTPTMYTGGFRVNNASMPVRALLGIRGLFTPRFGLSLFVGYGASFYKKGDNFDHVIANGELMFFFNNVARLKIGGQRDFVDAYYANFYVKNGGYLKYEHMFVKILLASLQGELYQRQYSFLSGQYGTTTPNTNYRKDLWSKASLGLELRATKWLSIVASVAYSGNVSNFAYSSNADPRTWVDFQRVVAMGGVHAHY